MSEARLPVPDLIVEELRHRIISGGMKPGQRIREEEIAAPYGVSRVPVREALRRLEAEGYVLLTRFQGASVAIPSKTAAIEFMQVRRPLEVLAARLAARRRGEPQSRQLRCVTANGLRSVEQRDREHHPELVDEFHRLIGEAAGNAELIGLLDQLRGKVRWVFAMDLEHRAATAWQAHRAILDAVLAGDEDEAAQLMDEHVAADESWYLSMLGDHQESFD